MPALSDRTIIEMVRAGNIGIDPFDEKHVQPSSYDLTLLGDGEVILRPINYYVGRAISSIIDTFIELTATLMSNDPGSDPVVRFRGIAAKLERVNKDNAPHQCFQLLSTHEVLTLPDNIKADVHGRSSLARKGLFIHVSAGFIDPGFSGQITLECINVSGEPISLLPGDRVAQVCFYNLDNNAKVGYDGRYQNQRGPTESRFGHGDD